jgi:hypothetical protein
MNIHLWKDAALILLAAMLYFTFPHNEILLWVAEAAIAYIAFKPEAVTAILKRILPNHAARK